MARYGLATIFENCPVGYEFTANNTPLHLTHVDSFEVELDVNQLASKLQQAVDGQRTFAVKAVADTFLGPNKDIPVTMLELTPELAKLHAALMDMLDSEGATLKRPHFHRAAYAPHISIYGSKKIAPGEEVWIKDISVGTKLGDGDDAVHRIVATVALSTGEMGEKRRKKHNI